MPLPLETVLSKQIEDFIDGNSSKDPAVAKKEFADFLAKTILDAIKDGDVLGVQTLVTGTSPSGPVTGVGSQTNIAKIS